MGIDGSSSTPRQTTPLSCQFQNHLFSHSFLVIPSCPSPLLGRDILTKLHTTISISPDPHPFIAVLHEATSTSASGNNSPHILLPEVNPEVWNTKTPSIATHDTPILIKLQNPTSYPNRPQFPVSKTHRIGLRPIIEKLKSQKLPIPTNSPCNTPHITSQKTVRPVPPCPGPPPNISLGYNNSVHSDPPLRWKGRLITSQAA